MTAPATVPSAQPELIARFGYDRVRRVAIGNGDIYETAGYGRFTCRICGKEIASKQRFSRESATNFARVSHGKMHVRKGEALSPYSTDYPGPGDFRLMPTVAQLEAAVANEAKAKSDAEVTEELRAKLVPLYQRLRPIQRSRQDREQELLVAIRTRGAEAFQQASVVDLADLVAKYEREQANTLAEIDALTAAVSADIRWNASRGL